MKKIADIKKELDMEAGILLSMNDNFDNSYVLGWIREYIQICQRIGFESENVLKLKEIKKIYD